METVLTSLDSKDVVKPKGTSNKAKNKETKTYYEIGLHLIQFMVERSLIKLATDVGVTEEVSVEARSGEGISKEILLCGMQFELNSASYETQSSNGLQTHGLATCKEGYLS